MRAIDSGRWLRASRHLDQVLELPPPKWPAYVADVRRSDPDTAAELEALIEDHRQVNAEGFLDTLPAIANPAPKPRAGSRRGLPDYRSATVTPSARRGASRPTTG